MAEVCYFICLLEKEIKVHAVAINDDYFYISSLKKDDYCQILPTEYSEISPFCSYYIITTPFLYFRLTPFQYPVWASSLFVLLPSWSVGCKPRHHFQGEQRKGRSSLFSVIAFSSIFSSMLLLFLISTLLLAFIFLALNLHLPDNLNKAVDWGLSSLLLFLSEISE